MPKEFKGKIELDIRNSGATGTRSRPRKAPPGSPNSLVALRRPDPDADDGAPGGQRVDVFAVAYDGALALADLHMEEILVGDDLPRPEDSREEHEHLLAIEEELVQEPGIPYRVVNIASGDLGLSAAKKYDIEEWFPGQQRFREITSTSNTTDLQARQLGIRYRPEQGAPQEVHTLNGTAVTSRSLIAILENFQDEDWSIALPPVLERYGASSRVGAAG